MKGLLRLVIIAACGMVSSVGSPAAIAQDDPGSLNKLHDIVTPPAVAFWPPAPGWYGVAALVAVFLLYALWRRWQIWRANAYRRAALAALAAIEQHWRQAPTAGNPIGDMQALLKRCALAAYPRDMVAGLSGAAWHGFLDQRIARDLFAGGLGAALAKGSYQGASTSGEETASLLKACRLWIKRHRPLPQQADGASAAPMPKAG